MKNTWARIMTMTSVFLVIIIALLLLLFRRGNVATSYGEQNPATLPTISFDYNGITLNELAGYLDVTEEENYYMQGMLLPLGKNRVVNLTLNKKSVEPTNVRYRIYDGKCERLYEEKSYPVSSAGSSTASLSFELTNLLPEGEEGRLYLYVTLADGREVFYSIRTLYLVDHYLDTFLTLTSGITDSLLAKDNLSIGQYLSFTEEEACTNLSYVSLRSSLRQATWAGLSPKIITSRSLQLYELSKTQASFSWLYTVETTENDHSVYYDVEEYYSMRNRDGKNFALAYERQTKEHFANNSNCMGTTSILLGIQEREDVSMKKTTDNKLVTFVVNQSVYCYNYSNNEMTLILSMDDDSLHYVKKSDWYQVKLLRMDDEGDLDLALWGYQTSGEHEGHCGLSVYHYDFSENAISEVIFVRVQGSYEFAQTQCGQIVYINQKGLLYFDFGGGLYSVDTDSLEYQTVAENLPFSVCVSKDGSLAAWNSSSTESQILLLDMESSRVRYLDSFGQSLEAIGFLEHDFVYGVCAETSYESGTFQYPEYLKELHIVDLELTEQAKYAKEGVLITKAVPEDYSVVISCVQKNEQGNYEAIPDNVLTSSGHEEVNQTVDLKVSSSNMKYNYYYITFGKSLSTSHLFGMRNGRFQFTSQRGLTLTKYKKLPTYQAYFAGRRVYLGDMATEAISSVFDQMGTVRSNNTLIWNRDARNLYVTLTMPKPDQVIEKMEGSTSLEAALEAFRQYAVPESNIQVAASLRMGQSAVGILGNMLGEGVVDLTGCTPAMILYYINERHPVLAIDGQGKAVLLCAYNSNSIFAYDPLTGEKTPYLLSGEADEFFGQTGFLFASYVTIH